MPQETTEEQIQKLQAKADVIGKLQRELKQDIQRFKLNRHKECGINKDMVNTGTKRRAPHMAAAPDRVIQDHNRGTKRQVGDALLWKRVPPEPGEPHTKMTK